jgi:hypothetical protein
MNTYKLTDENDKVHTITARNHRTAQRRFRGFIRGELTIEGRTILASKRKPPGRSMNPNRTAKGLKKRKKDVDPASN